MIKTFAHKGLEKFYLTGSKAGIQASHATRLTRQLTVLNIAKSPKEMDISGWRLHPLTGTLAGHWSISVDANWRLTFRFNGTDVEIVNYQDYH